MKVAQQRPNSYSYMYQNDLLTELKQNPNENDIKQI